MEMVINAPEKFLKNIFFGDRLMRLMEERNVSPTALAQEMDVTSATVYNYLRGETEPSCERLVFLARKFKVSLDYLITGQEKLQDPLPPTEIDSLIHQMHSQIHKGSARHYAMVGQIALELSKLISVASETAVQRAMPSVEFIESEHIVAIERCSFQTWIASKGLKYDRQRERVSVRFLSAMAENLCRGRSYRFLLSRDLDSKGAVPILKENLRSLCQATQVVEQHCQFRFTDVFPVVGFGLHQVDKATLAQVNGLLLSRVQDWIFPVDAEGYSGYWMGHIIAPVPRAEYFTLMDREHIEYALSMFTQLWQGDRLRI